MLNFVPRKVAKALRSQNNAVIPPSHSVSLTNHVVLEPHHRPPLDGTQSKTAEEVENKSASSKGKGKDTAGTLSTTTSEDHVILFRLAMSEHALWSNPDIRRKLEHSAEGCKQIAVHY
jgi:hypothetical protein